VNSIVRPNFKEKLAEICTCGSHEQYMGSTQKKADTQVPVFSAIQTYTIQWSEVELGKCSCEVYIGVVYYLYCSCRVAYYGCPLTKIVEVGEVPWINMKTEILELMWFSLEVRRAKENERRRDKVEFILF